MVNKHGLSIFIFRRDLRLDDNLGLILALKESTEVLPIFIFTPEQVTTNIYKSNNCVQFMVESLKDLDGQLKKKGSKLYRFYGEPTVILNKIIHDQPVEAVYVNMDYTPYSAKRDKKIETLCKKNKIDFVSTEDVLLNPIGSITTGSNEIYTKFTPYFNKAKKITVPNPIKNNRKNYTKSKTKIGNQDNKSMDRFYQKNNNLAVKGGRSEGMKKLRSAQNLKDYNQKRNLLTYQTSMLSAYNKFGCISIREVYHVFKKKLGMKNDLIKQLYWRDFYYNIACYYPHVFKKTGNLKEKYDKIKWDNNRTWLNKWKNGETGYPIVDACMTEMNQTGFMHNRGRLIVSSFLIKILQVDWKLGEKYFAQTLVDYDPSVNNGNWEWSAGSGADSQPYFRIFNPWTQGKKFDPKCSYIKKWLPQLSNVDANDIHNWDTAYDKYQSDYPKPMVDYSKQRESTLKMYKKVFN